MFFQKKNVAKVVEGLRVYYFSSVFFSFFEFFAAECVNPRVGVADVHGVVSAIAGAFF